MISIKKIKYGILIIVCILITSSLIILYKTNTINITAVNGQKGENFVENSLKVKSSQEYRPFSVGTSSGPHTLEIVDSWDSASNNVLEQVVETLFTNNLSDLDLPLVNLLAESYFWVNLTTLEIKLREGVLFQDGTPFNALAAKWNLDRLNYLIDATGENTGTVAQTKSLWCFPDGLTPIMNNTVVDSEYNITITLNGPYAPFLNTLTYINAGMISPTFHAADAESFIPISGNVCGTGPFVYDGYIPDERVNFHAFENYWQGKANITQMSYVIFYDANTAHQAFLKNEIDWNLLASDQNIATYRTIPQIQVYDFTEATGKPSLVYQYMGVNNHKYNATWRKAFAFAVNYSYVIDELRFGNAFRSYTAISPGFGAAYNESLPSDPRTVPDDGDITVARQIMQSMGFGLSFGLHDDDAWITQAETAPFKTVRYTYNLGNVYREDLHVALHYWLRLIGCATEDDGVEWDTFLDYLYDRVPGGFDHLGLYAIGWAPDYLEPYNMLDPLFNPASGSNSAQVNDTVLNILMANSLQETNIIARNNIYKHIQSYMATQGFNHIPLYHSKIVYAYSIYLTNFPHNTLNRLYFYPCNWTPQLAPLPAKIFIDDLDPDYNWTKIALENDWCTGAGTLNDPYIIEDLEINGEGNFNGIEIHNSTAYFKIENCTIHNCQSGIVLIEADNSVIFNNSIYDYTYSGIQLEFNNDNDVTLNKISNFYGIYGTYGIYLENCTECNIYQNLIEDGFDGIVVGMSTGIFISDNDLISNLLGIGIAISNNITTNDNYLFNNLYGIALQETSDNLVKNNQIIENNNTGIFLMGYYSECYNNTIIGNNIVGNGILGIDLNNLTSHNKIFFNNFIGNTLNAQDNGALNEWDNGVIGNYWDNYLGVDANNDGIGDTPYLIDGTTGSMDNYPKFFINPFITILSPNDGDVFGTSPPGYNIEIIDFNLDSMWYTMDDGINNITIESSSGILNATVWGILSDGPVTITFYANNTEGQIGFAQVTVIKDTTVPVIIINDPNTGEIYGSSPPEFDINVIEENIDTIWYTLDDGVNNITIVSYTGSLDATAWSVLSEGSVIITFYANDTLGHLGFAQVTVIKDTIVPVITINDPNTGEIYGSSPPEFDINVIEENIDTIWYTLDDGANNITIVSYTGSFDATAWSVLSDGSVIITFYASDTAGNIGSTQTTVIKDSISPVVIIDQPETGDEFKNDVPLYDIDVTELNLDSVWYTMNGGNNFTTITAYTGFLDETIWNTLPNGPVTIIFYANDTAGNLGSDTIIIYKSTPSNPPPFIPGPNSILIFFVTILTIVSLSWKSLEKIKTNLK